jgi:hypothetical protein
MPEISPQTQKLIQQYQAWYRSLQKKEGAATIHADEVASKVAAIYEKLRGVVDWREEHLLRRGAIERMLKRRLFLRAGQKLEAQPLILELIRAGHFPNDKIDESKIPEAQTALDKYVYIVEKSQNSQRDKNRLQLQDWLSTIAACEIEEIIDPPRKERILIDYMTELMADRINLKNKISDEEKNTQIHIAVQKALFKLDYSIISYHLIKREFPQWRFLKESGPQGELESITQNIYLIWAEIDKKLHHPLSEKFYRICERYDAPYLILGDVLSQEPEKDTEKLNNPEGFESEIKNYYQIRVGQQKSKVARAAFYTTLSIFITKILLALAVEYPIDKYWLHHFSLQGFGFNVIIPPILMLMLIATIKQPGKGNLGKVVMETMKITYVSKEKDVYSIGSSYGQNNFVKGVISVIYFVTFIGMFYLVWWVLGTKYLNFSWPSRIIFILFFSLIIFAGTKIRERAKELSVENEGGGFFGFIFDWLALPFVQLGKWLSGQWAKYNIILVIIITLIDLPFQIFVEFLEQWRSFIKEKKEEIH